MTDQTEYDDFFYGVMILKDGKWKPHGKYKMDAFGSALASAESLSANPGVEGVKVTKIPSDGSSGRPKGEAKDMWISPHLKARAEARFATRLQEGVKKTRQNIANAHEQFKANFKK